MDAERLRIIEERLAASGNQDEPWAMLVLAACESRESLDAVVGGELAPKRRRAGRRKRDEGEPLGAYLRSITVEGFRGVGPSKTLEITPGPGLTLVIGRDGCASPASRRRWRSS